MCMFRNFSRNLINALFLFSVVKIAKIKSREIWLRQNREIKYECVLPSISVKMRWRRLACISLKFIARYSNATKILTSLKNEENNFLIHRVNQ